MVKWSRSVVSDSLRPHGLLPTWLLCPWDFPGNSTGVDCHFLLQRIFPTQGSNPGLPHCRQTLYCLSHQRSPIMVQHAKYYSERINFTKTNAWEMMEESKQVLQMTMYLSPNLLLKQVPEEMSPWLTAQCNGDLPKKNRKKSHMLLAKSLCLGFQLFNQENNQWRGYKYLRLLAKLGWERTPAPITPWQQLSFSTTV